MASKFSGFAPVDKPAYVDYSRCIHCGLCLNHCPTYRLWHQEDCRACETACPSGVEYGKLVELARTQIEKQYERPLFSRVARDLVFRRLLPHPDRIAMAARFLRLYQRSGLAALARGTGILKLLGLQERESLLPKIDSEFFFTALG
jgi:glycolate oxidase iron-sulfur subunit